ncbi:hypothetical protein N0V88_007103 [Collariella sp. IMI 366227]|nr:hypothetical protein N0V88_007103 [Collariella sp. IMI 366227]
MVRSPPPEVLATWPKPNYVDPITRGPVLIIVELIFLPLALICLALRLYVKIRIMCKKEIDDWLMAAAAFFGMGVTICVVLAFARYGWDIHVWDVRPSVMITGRQVSFAAQALFMPATTFAKISILISYLRLAPINSLFRKLTLISIWFVAITNAIFVIVLFTQCIPVSSYWNLATNERDCVTEGPSLLAQAVVTVVSDFVVWVLPLPALYHAKLPLHQRVALIILFSFGAVVVFAACMRIYWIHYVVLETYDVTWEGFHLWMWTAVEVQLGIICGCVPWLKSLVKFWWSRRTVTDLSNGGTGASRGYARSDAPRTVTEGGTVFRMDSVAKSPRSPGFREKGTYIDLERCSGSSDPERGLG